MRLLYFADGRSQIALNWINYFIQSGHEVHLVSSYPCQPIPGLVSLVVIPVAMSSVYGQEELRSGSSGRFLRKILPVGVRTWMRQTLAPSSFHNASKTLQELIERIHPDIVHAMRIPFEGMIASISLQKVKDARSDLWRPPLLISVWGNDFTLHARSSQKMASHTNQAMITCDALHTDCHRDLRIAREYGFASTKPYIVLPGGGGIDLDVFFPAVDEDGDRKFQPKEDHQLIKIINPRGFRAYVRNDTVFKAIPLILNDYKGVKFSCTGMAGEAQAQRWIKELGISDNVDLLPSQPRQGMANLFRQSLISLSITTHDGTPNTLLEAMACGCFPICGDLESIREWITSGENGLLIDPNDPEALASAILEAISRPALLRQAAEINLQLIKERAEYQQTMNMAFRFYQGLVVN